MTAGPIATACPICGGKNLKLHLDGAQHALDVSAFGSSRTSLSCGRILRCADCDFGFSETRPGADQLKNLYEHMDTAVYESETEGRIRTARRHLTILSRHAGKPGRLLDVGCASGRFVEAASAAGWNAMGIEPSETLSVQARRLLAGRATVIKATLQQAALERDSFDAVTMWDVLEHVTNPVEFFETAAALIRPDGLMAVNVPNLDSLPARLFGRRWPLLLPEHLNYFTPRSLQACARGAGLTPLALGSRPVNFSVKYVLRRTAQHVRLLGGLNAMLEKSALGDRVVPVWMGEIYAVWRKAN